MRAGFICMSVTPSNGERLISIPPTITCDCDCDQPESLHCRGATVLGNNNASVRSHIQ